MKALTVLGVLQALGILVLVGHSFGNTDQVAARPSLAAIDHEQEQRLLQEIRQELQQLQTQLHMHSGVASLPTVASSAASQPAVTSGTEPTVAVRPRTDSSSREERDAVAQRIENYRGTGPVTEAQMRELQAAIMQLDVASRKQMMSRLIRAWKSGEINGTL